MRKNLYYLIIIILLVSSFSFIVLAGEDKFKGKSFDDTKNKIEEFTKDNSTSKYGKYDIYLEGNQVGKKDKKILSVGLLNNTDICGQNCLASGKFTLYENTSLVDDVRFFRLYDDGTNKSENIRGFNLEVIEANDEKNNTIYSTIIQSYKIKKVLEGNSTGINYTFTLYGNKRPNWAYDWQILTNGIWTEKWSTWGNISLGNQSEVILNSPVNNLITASGYEIFNCSANVTGGTSITNISLWMNNSGTWNMVNITNPNNGTEQNITGESYSLTGTSPVGIEGKNGLRFQMNQNAYVYQVKKEALVNGTVAYILDSSKNVIATSNNFSGQYATFSTPVLLTFGVTYYVAIDDYGRLHNRRYDPDWVSFPVVETYLNWTGGLFNGTDNSGNILDVESIIFNGYVQVTSLTTTWNNTINSTRNWTCQACDIDGVCGFSNENRTLSIDGFSPNITINQPSGTISSNNVTFNFTIADDFNSLSYCSYNVTTSGLGVIVAENSINCSNPLEYQTISDGVGYIVNVFANDTVGNAITSNGTFSVNTVVTPPAGGGGGSSVVVEGDAGWIAQVSDGIGKFEADMSRGQRRTFKIQFLNTGDSIRKIDLSCQDITGSVCRYVEFSQKQFELLVLKDTPQTIDFTINLPEDIEKGHYQFNIKAIDDNSNERAITVFLGVRTLGLIPAFFSRVFLSTTNFGLPYWLIFIPLLIGGFFFFPKIVYKKDLPFRAIWVILSSLLVAIIPVYLI
jgi:hypothetical protein